MNNATFPTAEFYTSVRLNPRWSTFVCFIDILRKRKKISRKQIRKAFDRLVDTGDYAQKDKRELMNYVFSVGSQEKNGGVKAKNE